MTSALTTIGELLIPNWDFNYACCREANLFFNALYAIFLVLNTLTFILYIYVFLRNEAIHVNFRVILLTVAISNMILIYHRIGDFWLTGRIDRENGFTYFIKMNCWYILIFSLCNIIAERSFALYAHRWYHDESTRHRTPMIAIYCVEEITAISLIKSGKLSKTFMLDFLAVIIISSFLLISSLFQILEGQIIMHFVVPIDHRYYLVSHAFFYLTIAVRVLFSLVIPIIAHPVIKKDATTALTRLVKKFRKRATSSLTAPEVIHVYATNGKPLSFSQAKENDMYFAGYKELW